MIDFNQLINNYLKRELRPKSIGKYYPSEAGNCIRKSYYSYMIPKDVDEDMIKVFELGNMLHAFIAEAIKSERNPHIELLKTEEPFQLPIDGLVISGRIDDIIQIKLNNKKYIVEVKSTSFLEATKEPNEGHILQLHVYMHSTQIHNGILLYLERNTLKTKAFYVDYNPAIFEEAVNRFRALHKFLTQRILPHQEAKMETSMNWQCQRCQYRQECDANKKV